MKKYKLIKEYPGSPKLGTVAEPSCMGGYNYYSSPGVPSLDANIPKKTIENNPEFWEEVVKKNYEILIYKDFNSGYKVLPKFKPRYNGNFNIYSIKRLSDGEVFTVGDKVTESIIGSDKGWEIPKFSIIDNKCFVLKISINDIEKIKQPLFTTEDGVEIFEGDDCYLVFTTSYKPTKTIAKKELLPVQCYQKFFSTKETAEEYVLVNKPCLSINDVKDAYNDGLYNAYKDHAICELTKLVKTRS